MFPIIGGAVFAILAGLIVGLFFRPARCLPGIRFTGKKILQYSIILLGFEMQIMRILQVGARSLVVMACTVTAAFAVAVFVFPALGRLLGMSDEGFGLWAGTAVNDTSSVVATTAAWGEVAGNNAALELATIVKLTRTLLIIPITLVLAFYTARKQGVSGTRFNFVKVFPWFVFGFVLAALVNSFVALPTALPAFLSRCGKFLIVAAMVAIGLSTDARSLVSGGRRPILLGLACWFAVAVVSIDAQRLTGAL